MTLLWGIRAATAIAAAFAAGLALRAATIPIHDDQDIFIHDLHLQSCWTTWAAVATSITAGLLVIQTFLDRRH